MERKKNFKGEKERCLPNSQQFDNYNPESFLFPVYEWPNILHSYTSYIQT